MRQLMLLACLLGGSLLGAMSPQKWFDKPRSARLANYRMEAHLDWPNKTLTGKATVTWKNGGTAPTSELPLHLYMNAFKGPDTLFMRGTPRPDSRNAESWGYCRLASATLQGRALEGHPGPDETVHVLRLPKAVAPGESISVELAWETRFPRVIARAGWGGHFLMAAQWYPKVGVYQGDRWVCHPYLPFGEFFADFGTYDLQLSLPNQLLPAHTGTSIPHGPFDAQVDPKRPNHHLWTLHAEDVHDFAFAVMPTRSWKMRKWEYRGVQIYCYHSDAHFHQLDRLRHAVQGALRSLADGAIPYPYPTLTVVDVPAEAQGAAGMEYPTLITVSMPSFDPLRVRLEPEGVAVHEVVHQIFQGVVASNEVTEPWLDEGLTSWFTARTMERLYQNLFASRRLQVDPTFPEWMSYWMHPDQAPMTWSADKFLSWEGLHAAVYAKPTLVFTQLEAMIGRPLMDEAIHVYATEMAFKHPTAQDLKRILERVSGRDLSGFWRDWVEGTDVLDYRIASVQAWDTLQGGWVERSGALTFTPPIAMGPGTRGALTLVRRGGLRVPLTLWVRLEDRTEHRLSWDGQDPSTTFTFESPIAAAVLDPDGNYPMLRNRLEASYTAIRPRRGFHYWAQLAWSGLTGLLQGMGLG